MLIFCLLKIALEICVCAASFCPLDYRAIKRIWIESLMVVVVVVVVVVVGGGGAQPL